VRRSSAAGVHWGINKIASRGSASASLAALLFVLFAAVSNASQSCTSGEVGPLADEGW
jgi:hypothetical protein